MSVEQMLEAQWVQTRDRLVAKQLLGPSHASLSLRIPGTDAMWFGAATDNAPRRIAVDDTATAVPGSDLHLAIYAARKDVGAIGVGGGTFGRLLAHSGDAMPGVFDEQVRHLGRMRPAVGHVREVKRALGGGTNALIVQGDPICLGMTATRLALNAELFEKCAKAFVLAMAAGSRVKQLPWLVRSVANGRLMKDERRAMERIQQGMLPEESRSY
ncbi:hypothetical protein [Paraburkholderia dinghuensis]|uniref:Uncharacterized protein n=1 Tax=Paraburkholderia dinghuensis TaxID=2305225 RepID=A0A3N6N4N3_9BURK|nr:hypothetical protein [Paraburkholderia dinghuensis]RQH03882.1 hypothetical protein D1Y85_19785 [Paraburkholderia dinghuensis]